MLRVPSMSAAHAHPAVREPGLESDHLAAPIVTTINPASGPILGGTAVTISGTDFAGATAVAVGGVAASGFTVVNATTITAVTPVHAFGVVNVVVTTASGTGTGPELFRCNVDAPAVMAVSPASGPMSGATAITITGMDFTGATAVTIGGVASSGFTVVNATTITAVTPGHASGVVNVVVTTASGTGTGHGLFTYLDAPAVTVGQSGKRSHERRHGNHDYRHGFHWCDCGDDWRRCRDGNDGGRRQHHHRFHPCACRRCRGCRGDDAQGHSRGQRTLHLSGCPDSDLCQSSERPNYGWNRGHHHRHGSDWCRGGHDQGCRGDGVSVVNATTIRAVTSAHGPGGECVVTGPTGVAPARGSTPMSPLPRCGDQSSGGHDSGGTRITITGTAFTGARTVTIGGVAAASVTVVNTTTITATTPAHTRRRECRGHDAIRY